MFIDGNVGDRNNFMLWDNGDVLICVVVVVNFNIIVVLYILGFVVIDYVDKYLNILVIFWVGFFG